MVDMFSQKSLSLFLVSLVAFIDLMGIGLVYPMFSSMLYQSDCLLLPADTSDGVRGACLGLLLSVMPLTQFFSAPILGMLSDQRGRKKILIPSLTVGCLGYLVALVAVTHENFILLLLSRIAVGISAGTASVVSAALADISSAEDKAKNFGILNMAFGLGFTVGPFLGGVLSEHSLGFIEGYSLPFAMAGVVTFLNLILIALLFKESYTPKTIGKVSLSLGIRNIAKAFQIKGLRSIFLAIFLACVGWSFYWEFAPVTWISQHGFSTSTIGNFYAYGAVVYALSCGIFIRPIVNRFANDSILAYALLGSSVFIGMLYFHTSDIWLWIYIPLQQFSFALFYPTAAAVISNAVSEDVQGEVLGVMHSVDSLAFGISPLIAGPLLGFSTSMPVIIGSLATFLAASVVMALLSGQRTKWTKVDRVDDLDSGQ